MAAIGRAWVDGAWVQDSWVNGAWAEVIGPQAPIGQAWAADAWIKASWTNTAWAQPPPTPDRTVEGGGGHTRLIMDKEELRTNRLLRDDRDIIDIVLVAIEAGII